MSVRIRHVVALAAIGTTVVLASTGPAAAAPAPTTTTDPAAAAAGWLSRQFVDASGKTAATGDHFNFPKSTFYWGGLTASGVFALAAAKVGGDKIDDAMAYMAKNVKSDAGLGSGDQPGPFDGSVATYAIAAEVAGADPTAFGSQNLLQALKDDECTVVSAPADDKDFTTPTCPAVGAARNIFSSVSESLAILAEARGAAQTHTASYAPSAAGAAYFLSLQCPGGGFNGETSACTSDTKASVDETAYAAQALQALGGHDAELAKAIDWLNANRNPAGYWVAQGGPDVDSTGLAVAALDGAGKDVATSRAWLASQEVTTGPTVGTGASRGALKFQGKFDASSSIKGTADGLLGLAPHGSLATLTSTGVAASAPALALAPARASSASLAQGATQTITGTGFSAGEKVSGVLHSSPAAVGTATASTTGTVSLRFTVPTSTTAGSHTVVLTGATSGLSTTSGSFSVTVAPAAPSSPGTTAPAPATDGGLAATGLDGPRTLGEGLLGVGLILAGGAAAYAGRRRRA
jgi:hypothetical protein